MMLRPFIGDRLDAPGGNDDRFQPGDFLHWCGLRNIRFAVSNRLCCFVSADKQDGNNDTKCGGDETV